MLFMLCAGAKTSAQDIYDHIDSLDHRSIALLVKGQYKAALDSTLLMLKLMGNDFEAELEAKAYNNAAICLKELGKYDRADGFYTRSIELATDTSEVKDLYRYHYSNYLLLIGAYQKAIDTLMLIETPKYEFQKLLNLSNAYFRRGEQGDMEKALAYMEQYLSSHDSTDNNYPIALQNKGYIYWDCGELDSAKQYIKEALELMEGEKGRDYYISLGNLAMVEEFDTALSDINAVLEWQKKNIGTEHPDYTISLRKKAEILLKAGKMEDALQAFKQYYENETEFIIKTFPDSTQEYRLNYWYAKKPLISEIFQLKDKDPSFLYDVALLRRQMALLGNSVNDLRRETNISVSMLRDAMKSTEAAVEFVCYFDEKVLDTIYAALVASPNDSTKFVCLPDKKALHGYSLKDGTELEEGVCSSSAGQKNLIYTDSVLARKVWDPIFAVLPKETRQLYFAPDGILQMLGIEYLPYEGLNKMEVHRLTSTANLLHRSASGASRGKRALVIGGVDYNGKGKVEEAVDSIDQRAYNYLKQCGLNVEDGIFSYLQGSKTETDSIIGKLKEAKNSEEERSSEDYLKQHLGDYDLVHLSTHGYSLKVNVGKLPVSQCDSARIDNTLLASGIALRGANVAGASGEREDGLLSARELCDLDGLDGVDLVVLSACQTAQGVVSDEGPAGVVRGFKKAGVHSVMATLWPVDDNATALFMTAFYDALKNPDCTKHEALLKAQEAVRNYTLFRPAMRFSPRTLSHCRITGENAQETEYQPYTAPYYWAPFIMIDDI